MAPKPVAAVAAPSSLHFVNHGDTLASIARKNHISAAELARANGFGGCVILLVIGFEVEGDEGENAGA